MTYGVIDVGSNTIRLCIYDVVDGKIRSLFNNKTTAGLIGYVSEGEMSARGIKKACDVLNTHKEMAARAQIENLFVFATASRFFQTAYRATPDSFHPKHITNLKPPSTISPCR